LFQGVGLLGLRLGPALLARLPAPLSLEGEGFLGILDAGPRAFQVGQFGLDPGALGGLLGRVRRDGDVLGPEAEHPHPRQHGELVRGFRHLAVELGLGIFRF
jgi:hypothetical protein